MKKRISFYINIIIVIYLYFVLLAVFSTLFDWNLSIFYYFVFFLRRKEVIDWVSKVRQRRERNELNEKIENREEKSIWKF